MVLGDVFKPKSVFQEAPRGPKTAKKQKSQNPGNHILRVSMGRSIHYTTLHYTALRYAMGVTETGCCAY